MLPRKNSLGTKVCAISLDCAKSATIKLRRDERCGLAEGLTMSTARIGLPTSLTPEVLREILRYERRQWRPVKALLVKKRAKLWQDMRVSDDDFYDKLHKALKDPGIRREFEIAAKARGSQNHASGLYRRIIYHYIRELRHEEAFPEELLTKATARQVIEAVSRYDDDDRLANVVWAILEDGGLSDAELSEITAEHPEIGERFKAVVDGEAAAGKSVADQWESGLSRLGEALEKADARHPDLSIVEQLADLVNELRALAKETERSAAFSSSLLTLIRQHATVLSDRPALKPYVDRVEENPFAIEAPENADEVLGDIDRILRSIQEAVDRVREKSTALGESDAVERSKLLSEIIELHATENDEGSRVTSLFRQLLGDLDSGVSEIPVRRQSKAASIASSEHDADDDRLEPKAEELIVSADDNLPSNETKVPGTEIAVRAKTQLPEGDQQKDADSASSRSGKASESDKVSDPTPTADTGLPLEANKGSQAGLEDSNVLVFRPTTEDEAARDAPEGTAANRGDSSASLDFSAPDDSHSQSVAMDALNVMLSSRRFARAYWLTRADQTIGDPNLYGALCEGARIGPGDPCPGALAHFFNSLAQRDQWQDYERLLLAASVLGSCLFVDPLPQDIYQLAAELPDDSSPVGQFMQSVRELFVYQNAKINPEDLGVEPAGAARNVRLDELRNDADHFLQRVPHIRFQYAPADFAIQYLYRAGSEWHRLHTIMKGRHQVNRLNDVRSLVERLVPGEVVAALHNDGELSALKQPLVGRARDKLTRHLHDTLALSREWIGLVSEEYNGNQGGNRSQSLELLEILRRALPNARKSLAQTNNKGAVNALNCVLEDLEARVSGGVPKKVDSINGDILLLSGLVLEDDLEPAEKDLNALGQAILNAEHSGPDPKTVLSECLSRREFRRARDIIEICKLGEGARNEYERAVNEECEKLESDLRDLELEIEDAYLLGQLRDNADENDSADDQSDKDLERSKLLGVVRNTRRQLSQSEHSPSDELRSISVTVDGVKDQVVKMAAGRQNRLRHEFEDVMKQLPETTQGEADRDYLREAFNGCIKDNDHVAAFDLLERGRRAAQGPEPMVRASTGSSEELERFLKRADGHRDALSKRDCFRRLEDSIQKGSTFSEIPFGQLDRNRRNEAASAVRVWHSLIQARFSNAHRELKDSLEELLRFIGLPLREGVIQDADTTQRGFAHIRVTLSRPVTASPLPAFGSANGCRYEVVVSQTRKEPAQFEEYIRARDLAGQPVLALHLLPQSPAYRIRWQRHFARVQITALPFDSVFLLHLCGERNRLPALFELGLPFTWTRPYITKGENVASEMFVGRRNETAALIDPRGSCIVFGGRQLGKSALLRHVLRELDLRGLSRCGRLGHRLRRA